MRVMLAECNYSKPTNSNCRDQLTVCTKDGRSPLIHEPRSVLMLWLISLLNWIEATQAHRENTIGQIGAAWPTVQLVIGHTRRAKGTVGDTGQHLHLLGRLLLGPASDKSLEFPSVARVDLVTMRRAHQHRGVGVTGELEPHFLALDDCARKDGHEVYKLTVINNANRQSSRNLQSGSAGVPWTWRASERRDSDTHNTTA